MHNECFKKLIYHHYPKSMVDYWIIQRYSLSQLLLMLLCSSLRIIFHSKIVHYTHFSHAAMIYNFKILSFHSDLLLVSELDSIIEGSINLCKLYKDDYQLAF